ncbi:MAG: hypothetical protein B6U72_02145 [Candidatus Altiarchaeales archaeon ex4484_2]|nr:MAG: hypothetical protein B6U72_02145 [Candidatus Altiarchaeales archaeon ex4484_2]
MAKKKKISNKTKVVDEKEQEFVNRLADLEFKENELDSRMEVLDLKEKELELEISKLKFIMKKRKDLMEQNKITGRAAAHPTEKKAIKKKKPEKKKKTREIKEDDRIGEERRSILASQIKSVLKRQQEAKKQEELNKKLLESKKIINKKEISVVLNGDEKNGAMKLFQLIVDKKSIKLNEAAEVLGMAKGDVKKMAKELEKAGFITLSTPFYGEPKLNLKIAPTREISEMFKREYS